jgi:type IV pilus assembly protein PilY1
MRSSGGNPLYYDPKTTYPSWPSASDDKTRMPAANPVSVNISPDDPSSTSHTLDITTRRGQTGADDETKNYWPATYYVYTGTTPLPLANPNTTLNIASNFTKYEIKSDTATPTFPRAATRTDCTGAVGPSGCSYSQELQNFANWLQYYRDRRLMAKGGVAEAFSRQGTNLRVGFASINTANSVSGGGTTVVPLPVKPFSGAARQAFYNDMYPLGGNGNTPLRNAMDQVGQYFANTGAGNPWAEDPTSSSVGTEWTCRKSFHILSTDGYWNSTGASGSAASDNDSLSGKTPKKPGTTSGYDYSNTGSSTSDPLVGKYRIDPYADGATGIPNTLADCRRVLLEDRPAHRPRQRSVHHLARPGVLAARQHLHGRPRPQRLGHGAPALRQCHRRAGERAGVLAVLPVSRQEMGRGRRHARSDRDPQARDEVVAGRHVHQQWPGRRRHLHRRRPDPCGDQRSWTLLRRQQPDVARLLSLVCARRSDQQEQQPVEHGHADRLPPGRQLRVSGDVQPRRLGRPALRLSARNTTGGATTTPGTEVWEASQQIPDPDQRLIYTWNDATAKGTLFTWTDISSTQRGYLAARTCWTICAATTPRRCRTAARCATDVATPRTRWPRPVCSATSSTALRSRAPTRAAATTACRQAHRGKPTTRRSARRTRRRWTTCATASS